MSLRESGVERDRFARRFLRDRKIVASQQHARRQYVSRRRLGGEAILSRECLASIVITASVQVAKAQYIVRVDIGVRNRTMCLLEQWNRFGGLSLTKKAHALHLHRFKILRILGNRLCKRGGGFGHFFLLVEHHASEIFHTDRFRLFRSQGL